MKAPQWIRDKASTIGTPTNNWQWGKVALIVLVVVLLLALLSKWSGDSHRYPRHIVNKVKSLVQESVRWSVTSTQDSNGILSLMHSTYAIAYLNVARHLVPDKDIVRMVGIQPPELLHDIQEKQNAAIQMICKECPQLQPSSGKFTSQTGWLG